MLEYFRESSQLICTTVGGLVNISTWYKNDEIISNEDDTFSETVILNKTTSTSQLVLFSGSKSNFVGLFTCEITDGNGRTAISTLQLNGNFIKYYTALKFV